MKASLLVKTESMSSGRLVYHSWFHNKRVLRTIMYFVFSLFS